MKQFFTGIKNLAKGHFYVFILLLLALFFFHNIISITKIPSNGHYVNDVTFYSYNMKKSLQEGTLPLWTPYYYSGRPLFAQPEYYFIDLNLFLILLTGNIYLAMNFSVITHFFLAGLGMYLLVYYLSDNKKSGFVSALIYMFNGYIHTFVVPGNIMILEGYSLIPFLFFFIVKALKSKNFIFNSVVTGIFIASEIFVGGVIFFPYLLIIIFAYSIFYLIGKNFLNRLLRLILVGAIIGTIGFGLSAIKLLPGLDFLNLSNRQIGVSYQEYLGEPVIIKNFVFAFISNIASKGSGLSSAVGAIGFILLIFGLYRHKNRTVLFSASVILLSFFTSSESFLAKFLFSLPIFDQTRHVERSLFIFAFAASILAGFGFLNLDLVIEKYKKLNKKIIFIVIVLLICLELVFLQVVPPSSEVIHPKDIPILDYMGKDPLLFRTINLGLKTLIGATGYNYYSQLGISEIKGGSGIWFDDYINFLIIAQSSPAKMWGILNNKYVILDKKTEIDGLRLVDKFKDCRECTLWESFGPYLYENTRFLPRNYIVPSSILIVGNDKLAEQVIYSLMLKNFEPSSAVLIQGTRINDYSVDFLKRFNAIFLVKDSVDEDSIPKLRDYVKQGGILVPDILNGKNSVTNNDIDLVSNITSGHYKEVNVSQYLNNKVVVDLNGEKGWLVASERFAYFPGWTATINGKDIELFKADNVITAIYLNGENGKLELEYKPDSYKIGKLISIASFVLLFIYFLYFIYLRKLRLGDKNQA